MDTDGAVVSPLLGDVKLGFTSHRHDDDLGLIDMRGRVFDPAQKRFLTPDPHVPDPLFGQSYNRFAYVLNNPLRYTDPTGFQPAPGDLRVKGGMSDPQMSAAPVPVPMWPYALTRSVVIVKPKADDTGERPPPEPPISKEEQDRKWADFFKKMSWGAAKQLFWSNPEVIKHVKNYQREQRIATAREQLWSGDWDLAAATVLEIPQDALLDGAEGLLNVVTGPIEAALDLPESVRTMHNPAADPEKRGAAAVKTAQNIAVVAATLIGAGRAVKAAGKASTLQPGPHAKHSVPARSPLRDFTRAERDAVNRLGYAHGCHTCGAKTPGTKSGDFVPDHQPPNAVNRHGAPQELYPHCLGCSRRQGGEARSQ